MKRMISLFISLCLLLTVTGCSKGESTAEYYVAAAEYPELTSYAEAYDTVSKYEQSGMIDWGKLEKAYEELHEAMAANNAQLRALRQGAAADCPDLTDFTAVTVEQLFGGRQENTVYSPVSLYLALAMLSESTAGQTRAQVTELMGIDDPRTAAKALWEMTYADGRGKTLAANSMWMGRVWPVKQELADILAEYYYADTFSVPMGTAEADDAMHSWLNEHTGNLLEDAVEGIETDPDTVMTLMNTVYFEQMWLNEFRSELTHADTFTMADGTETEADFMHTGGSGAWYRGENYVMAARSFQDDGGRMVFILPDEGVLPEQLLTDVDALREILTAGHDQYSQIKWSVPKFDVSSDVELSEQLQAMGIVNAFDSEISDFTPTTEAVDVELSQVQHAARVTIDENGCTAAAFTVMMMNAGAAMPPDEILEMNLNRPFAFVIFSGEDVPLFIGTVYEP